MTKPGYPKRYHVPVICISVLAVLFFPVCLPKPAFTFIYTLENSGCGGGPYGDNAFFTIDGDQLKTVGVFDYETTPGFDYTICIRTDDESGGTFDKEFTIAVNNLPPAVADVTSPTANGAYKQGEKIDVTVRFDEEVNVVTGGGTPTLTLETGAADAVVDYSGGTGLDTLTFEYTIAAGENSGDLDYIPTDPLKLNGGTIRDGANADGVLSLPTPGNTGSLGYNKALIVDTVVPAFVSVDDGGGDNSYRAGETITFDVDLGETGLTVTADLTVINSTFSNTQGLTDDGDNTYSFTTSDVDINGGMLEGNGIPVTFTAADAADNQVMDNSLLLDLDKTPPTVDAGPAATENTVFNLAGSASDIPSGLDTTQWTKVSGPGNVFFGDDTSPTSSCSMDFNGDYVLRLTAVDNAGNTNTADVTITWTGTQTHRVDTLVDEDNADYSAGDYSLREAIDQALTGDRIEFDVIGTITLGGTELEIDKNLTIIGPTANGLTVDGNGASRVFNITGGVAAISNLTVTGGSAAGDGGGILNAGTLTVEKTTVSGNAATGAGNGGGIGNTGTLTVINSTISENTAAGNGGGIDTNANLTLNNATIFDNTDSSGNNAINAGGPGDIGNSIVAEGCTGSMHNSQGYNIERFTNCGLNSGTDHQNTDPLLNALADNGGPTWTHAPQTSSPAIDAGDNASAEATDQRGINRPVDGDFDTVDTADIGAFEYNPGMAQFSSAAYSGAENGGDVVITVTRTGGSDGAGAVNYFTSNGTAAEGADYTAAAGVATWNHGESANKTFNVTILDDDVDEPNETVNLTLNTFDDIGQGARNTAVLTINDDDLPPPPPTFTISGKVTDGESGAAVMGATIKFSHDNGAAATNADGDYSYDVVKGTATTVTPEKSGYSAWDPPSATFNDITENKNQDFKGTLETFTISGRVTDGTNPVEGVTLTFSHDNGTATTDADGRYSYAVAYGTTTTITPGKEGFVSWNPPNAAYSGISGDVTQDFTGTRQSFTISGRATDGTDPIEGVTLTFSHDNGTTATDANGNYSYTVAHGTTTTVTPGKEGWGNWQPPAKTFENITENQTQDFVGVQDVYQVSGTVTVDGEAFPGVTITYSQGRGTTVTDSEGGYSFLVDSGTTTTITPSHSDAAQWTPPNRTLENVVSDRPGQDFQAALIMYDLNVTRSGDGTGTVASVPPGIDCGADCTEPYSIGTTVTLSASADEDSSFDGWSGGGCSGKGDCAVTMDAAKTVNAAFSTLAITRYTLAVTVQGGGSGTVTSAPGGIDCGSVCQQEFDEDTKVTLTAAPDFGSVFVGWQGDASGTGQALVTIDDDKNVTAVFEKYTLYVFKTGTGEGGVTSTPPGIDCGTSCSHAFEPHSTVLLTAEPEDGSTFTGWSGGGCDGTAACEVFIDRDISVTAAFDLDEESADLALTKEVDTFNPTVGGNVTFIIRVTNNGPGNAAGIEVVDRLPEGLTHVGDSSEGRYDPGTGLWSVGSLNSGQTSDLAVNASFDTSSAVTNTARITASDLTDPNSVNDTASVTLDPQTANADIWVVKTGNPNPVVVGDTMKYAITVGNCGPSDAEGAKVTDVIPPELSDVEYKVKGATGGFNPWPGSSTLSLGSVEMETARTIWIRGRVAAMPEDGLLANTAEVESNMADPDMGNNASTTATTVIETAKSSDLSIVKSVDKETSAVGENLVFTITVTNNGPDKAEGVKVRDKLRNGLVYVSDDGEGSYRSGSGIWNVGDIENGQSETLKITARIGRGGAISNTALIFRSGTTDENRANNSSTVIVNGQSDAIDPGLWTSIRPLGGASTAGNFIADGDRFEFVVKAADNGLQAAAGLQVQITLPEGLAVVEAAPSTGCYDLNSNIWHVHDPEACAGSLIEPSETTENGNGPELRLVLEVTGADQVVQAVVIAQIINLSDNDPDTTNNASSQVINQVEAFVVDLALEIQADRTVLEADQTVLFTIMVRNTGPDTASSVQVENTLPIELTLIGSYPSVGRYNRDHGRWCVGNLEINEMVTLELLAEPYAAAKEAVFEAEVSSVAEFELNPGNDSGRVIVEIVSNGPTPGGGGGEDGGCFIETINRKR